MTWKLKRWKQKLITLVKYKISNDTEFDRTDGWRFEIYASIWNNKIQKWKIALYFTWNDDNIILISHELSKSIYF